MHAASGRSSHAAHASPSHSRCDHLRSSHPRERLRLGRLSVKRRDIHAVHLLLYFSRQRPRHAVCFGADLSHLPGRTATGPRRFTTTQSSVSACISSPSLAHVRALFLCRPRLRQKLEGLHPTGQRLQLQLPRASSPTARLPTNTARAPKHGAPSNPTSPRLPTASQALSRSLPSSH